jgi:uncharacterized SAM-binding protein YcdF (DUF218 family)
MPFKAAAIALLVPPTSLLFLALAGLFILRWRQRAGRLLLWCGLLGLLVLALPAVGGSLLVTLEQGLPLTPPQNAPPQAIVILAAEIRRVRDPASDLPGPLSLERVRAGAALFRRTHLPILLSGGTPGGEGPPAAVLMAASLQRDFQIPATWVEAQSLDTWENAQFSAAILHAHGINSIYLVTHAWHMKRALMAFAHTGISVTAAPTELDAVPVSVFTDFLPNTLGWEESYLAFHEWIGCAWYALR